MQFISAVTNLKWLILFLGLGFLVLPEVTGGGTRRWVLVSAAVVVALGFVPIWRYQHNPRSMRALFQMTDGAAISMFLLLPLGLAEMAYAWLKNFWLYRDYCYIYFVLFAAIFLYFAVLNRGAFRQHFIDQMLAFRTCLDHGRMDETDFYNVLMRRKGAKEAIRNATAGRYAVLFMPLAVVLPLIGFWGGRDYLVYASFLAMLFASPYMIAARLRRRYYQLRYLGMRDIEITSPANTHGFLSERPHADQ